MTERIDPLEDFDELPQPERNHAERVTRIKQIIADIRREFLSEKDSA